MRLIDADALKEMMFDKAVNDADVNAMFSPYQVAFEYFDIEEFIDNAPTIEPIDDIISCGVSADTSADQNVADVPNGDLISRAEAIETINNIKSTDNWQGAVIALLSALPSADRPKGDPETEPAPVVAYICDRRRCAICSGPDGGCDHTTDIKHAAHFKNVAGQYFERPYMEEEDDGKDNDQG